MEFNVSFREHRETLQTPLETGESKLRFKVIKNEQGVKGQGTLTDVASKTIRVFDANCPKIQKDIQTRGLDQRRYVPLTVSDKKGVEHLVYVKISHLTRQTGLVRTSILSEVKTVKSEEQLAKDVKGNIETYAKEFQGEEVRLSTLKARLEEPVSSTTRQQADMLLARLPRNANLESISAEKPQLFAEYQQSRTAGSNSISKEQVAQNQPKAQVSKSQNDNKKMQNWENADIMLREMAKSKTPITIETLCKINAMLQEGTSDAKDPGKLRTETGFQVNTSGGFLSYIAARHVTPEVKNFLNWMEEKLQACEQGKENPLIIGTQIYKSLVSIHPFSDANGRTCRLLMDYAMQRMNLLPPSLGKDIAVACFGQQYSAIAPIYGVKGNKLADSNTVKPDKAVEIIMHGMINAYNQLNIELKK